MEFELTELGYLLQFESKRLKKKKNNLKEIDFETAEGDSAYASEIGN